MCDRNYIDKNDIRDAGIILVSGQDPISRLTMSITKQEFSSIGFYYTTTVTGNRKILVFIMDTFGGKRPEWLKPGDTLEDLINNPLIKQLAIKQLNPVMDENGIINVEETRQLEAAFRSAIAQVMSMGSENSIREAIEQLFGYRVDNPTTSNTAIEMVNRVIKNIGKWEEVPQNHIISLEDYDILKPPTPNQMDARAKIQLVGYLGSGFNQQVVPNPDVANKQIQSYIVPNKLFGNLYYIKLPARDPQQEELEMSKSLMEQRPYLTKAISTFIDMILMDQEFMTVVLKGIHNGKFREEVSNNVLKECLKDLIKNKNNLITMILKWMHDKHLNLDELKSIITSFNDEKKKYSLLLGEKMPESILSSSINHNKLVFLNSNDANNLNQVITNLYHNIKNAIVDAKNQNTIKFNLNDMIDSINHLCEISGNTLPKLHKLDHETSMSAIAYTNKHNSQKIPINLKSGHKIIIPLKNAKLNNFTRDELLEILQTLDFTPDFSHKYDDLRAALAKELSERCH